MPQDGQSSSKRPWRRWSTTLHSQPHPWHRALYSLTFTFTERASLRRDRAALLPNTKALFHFCTLRLNTFSQHLECHITSFGVL